MQKSDLVHKILSSSSKQSVTGNIDYIRGIYRTTFSDDQAAQKSKIRRKGRDYRWFEVYYLDE
jgi:hypothetical protein